MARDIVHIAKGGLGSIKEILDPLVTNKLKFGKKKIIAVGKEYWKPIVKQFIDAAKEGNIKAENMNLLFVADTPEEAKRILGNFDRYHGYAKKRTNVWRKAINGEINEEELF